MPNITGHITAHFGVEDESGKSYVKSNSHAAPLKLAKTFPLARGQIAVYMMDCSPGMMDGDHYQLSWRIDANTHVFLTNQSYTKVHPSLTQSSTQTQEIVVGANALLEYFPEPIMLYRDAKLFTETQLNIAKGGTVILSDILCAGRVANGERFRFKVYVNKMKVYYDNKFIYYTHQKVLPDEHPIVSPGGWEDYTHFGNLYVFSDQITSDIVSILRHSLDAYPHLLGGVSLTSEYGLLVSVLGQRAWEIEQIFQLLWGQIRQSLLHLPPLVIRK